MSTIKSSGTTFYANGSVSAAMGGYYGVGYSSYGAVLTMCFDFTTDSYGASSMTADIGTFCAGGVMSTSAKICCYITNSSDTSYCNAIGTNSGMRYYGVSNVVSDSTCNRTFNISDITLSPNTAYKLWLFPYDTTASIWPMYTSASATLTTTPLASSISATNVTIGGTSTIKINKASSSFTHTITYNAASGTKTGTIATKTTSSQVSFAIGASDFSSCFGSSGTSFQIVITCDTYNGSSKIGSSTCTITVSGQQSALAPTVSYSSFSLSPVKTSLTGTSKLILNAQSITINFTASVKSGATISSAKITNGIVTQTATVSGTTITSTFSEPTSATFTCSVTDSRGYTGSVSYSVPSVNYVKPTMDVSVAPPPTDGTTATITVGGKCFSGSFGSSNNSITIYYKKKTVGGSYGSLSSTAATLSNGSYSKTISITGLTYTDTYVFYVYVVDAYGSATEPVEYTSASKPLFYWNSTDFYFNSNVHLDGGVSGGALDNLDNMVTRSGTSAVGSSNTPVYINSSGVATACFTPKVVTSTASSNLAANGGTDWYLSNYIDTSSTSASGVGVYIVVAKSYYESDFQTLICRGKITSSAPTTNLPVGYAQNKSTGYTVTTSIVTTTSTYPYIMCLTNQSNTRCTNTALFYMRAVRIA